MQYAYVGPIKVARTTFDAALTDIRRRLAAKQQTRIAFCNTHTAFLAFRDEEYLQVISKMTVFNDGVGLDIALKLLEGRTFPENLNGTDFVPHLLAGLEPLRIFLLGATPDAVHQTAEDWSKRFLQHRIVGFHHGQFPRAAEAEIVNLVNQTGADALLVGMGNPRQETFIVNHAHELNCRLVIGVGALFDFASGRVRRAPLWIRRLRMEWLFRLVQEPRRLFRRYSVEAVLFIGYIAIARMRRRKLGPRAC